MHAAHLLQQVARPVAVLQARERVGPAARRDMDARHAAVQRVRLEARGEDVDVVSGGHELIRALHDHALDAPGATRDRAGHGDPHGRRTSLEAARR